MDVERDRVVEAVLVVAVSQAEVRRQVQDVEPVEGVERRPPRFVVVVGDTERWLPRRGPVERPDGAQRAQRIIAVDGRAVLASYPEPGVPELGPARLLGGTWVVPVEPGTESVGR